MNGEPASVPNVVDRKDVGMVEATRRLGFLLEALQPIGIIQNRRRQDFDRDVAPELVVPGAVDLSHAASAQQADDLVPAQTRSRRQAHGIRLLAVRRGVPCES